MGFGQKVILVQFFLYQFCKIGTLLGLSKKAVFATFLDKMEKRNLVGYCCFFAMLCMANKGGVADHNSVLTGLELVPSLLRVWLLVAIIEVCIFKHTKAQDAIKRAKPGMAAS
jgi:hypothetical protein